RPPRRRHPARGSRRQAAPGRGTARVQPEPCRSPRPDRDRPGGNGDRRRHRGDARRARPRGARAGVPHPRGTHRVRRPGGRCDAARGVPAALGAPGGLTQGHRHGPAHRAHRVPGRLRSAGPRLARARAPNRAAGRRPRCRPSGARRGVRGRRGTGDASPGAAGPARALTRAPTGASWGGVRPPIQSTTETGAVDEAGATAAPVPCARAAQPFREQDAMDRPFRRIAVVGAGAMGRGIAQLFAQSGFDVVVHDTRGEAIDAALAYLQSTFGRLAERGKMSEEEARASLGRVSRSDSLDGLAGCDLVIEAIVERPEVKPSLFGQLEAVCAPDAVLATNTSSLSVTAIASACEHPGRITGYHFFNPVPLMKVVEVVRGAATEDGPIDRLVELARIAGHRAVVTRDYP